MRVFFTLFLVLTTPSFALFDAQLLMGSRSGTLKSGASSESIGGSSTRVAAHLDPIPLIPVSFGFYYMIDEFDVSPTSTKIPANSLDGYQLGLDVAAWLPVDFFDITPYAHLGYSFLGEYKLKNNNYTDGTTTGVLENTYDPSGTQIGGGVKWNPIAIVSIMLQIDMVNETYAARDSKLAGLAATKEDLKNDSGMIISFGIEAGL